MAYTTIKKPTDYFNTKLYTGTGSSNAITGVGFQPDMVWNKIRSTTGMHRITDAVRGVTKEIYPDGNDAEDTQAQGVTAFGTDGFTVGTNAGYNTSGENYASWNWKANGAGSANTDGSINTTSTSVNSTSKFSISKWTGNATAGASIGHGLGVAPEFVVIKRLEGAQSWYAWNKTLGDNYLEFDTSTTTASDGLTVTSSTITFPNAWTIYNASGETMICYAFAPVTGYSKIGSYIGNNNSDGTFVYTGFKPGFIIIKCQNQSTNWYIYDCKRKGFNEDADNTGNMSLRVDTNQSEATSSGYYLNILSNGFKCRIANNAINGNGDTYVYYAVAEEPLVGDNPATAR